MPTHTTMHVLYYTDNIKLKFVEDILEKYAK